MGMAKVEPQALVAAARTNHWAHVRQARAPAQPGFGIHTLTQRVQALGALLAAAQLVANWPRPVINRPEHIAVLSRDGVCAALAGIGGMLLPRTIRTDRGSLGALAAGDIAEYTALKRVFGDRVHEIPVSATKGATGHLLGALWAAEAWGGYWSWDPKETWALIVWLNYAAWLHMRLMTGLRGRVASWWALVGLLVTTFAFLGVNMFLSGLHSYGKL